MHGEQCDVEMIINGIKNTSIRQTKHYLEDIRHPLAEVHIAAIVLCEDNTHVLLALRSEEKTLFPGCWEFGCAQLSQGFTPIDLLKKDYKDDFDLDIRFTLDTPISTYSIDRSNSIVPGFIYTATADRSELLKDSSKKHSKIQWMDIATLNENTSIECSVPNLLRDINRAQKAQSMIINSSS
jgi:isopentenyldiphosphate isomerase